jgi:hypothetical protein
MSSFEIWSRFVTILKSAENDETICLLELPGGRLLFVLQSSAFFLESFESIFELLASILEPFAFFLDSLASIFELFTFFLEPFAFFLDSLESIFELLASILERFAFFLQSFAFFLQSLASIFELFAFFLEPLATILAAQRSAKITRNCQSMYSRSDMSTIKIKIPARRGACRTHAVLLF